MKEISEYFVSLITEQADEDVRAMLFESKSLNTNRFTHPARGSKLELVLKDAKNKDAYNLNISTHAIRIEKVNYHLRELKTLPLLRLDLFGVPHRNPDGEKISENHLHIYKDGFEDTWAYPIDSLLNYSKDRVEIFQGLLLALNLTSTLKIDKDILEEANEE